MNPPLFSVVIPAYNAATFIANTLDSVRDQTLREYEIIVVDDGSRDDTKGVVDRWLAKHGLPGRCIPQENRKIAGARNTGMRAATADYIALLDHDDLWYPEKLAAVAATFRTHPDAVLVGHHIDMTKDGRLIRTARMGPAVPRMYERLLFGGNAVSPSAAVFRRDKAHEIGGFRENPAFNTVEDYDFWLRLSRVGRFVFIDQALSEYSIVENSASSRVEYQRANLEALLQDHFASYFQGDPGFWGRLLMRRRLAAVYRGAAGALAAGGASRSERWGYVRRMLLTYPLDLRNIARALFWLVGKS
jgi:glycosyltransferase involved in cell wall biosynthesis